MTLKDAVKVVARLRPDIRLAPGEALRAERRPHAWVLRLADGAMIDLKNGRYHLPPCQNWSATQV